MNSKKLPVVLRNKDFFLMWLGQMFGQAGLRMFQIAALWWIVTGSSGSSGKAVGIFMVVSALPSIAFVKLIGKTIDRFKARQILLISDAVALIFLFLNGFFLKKSLLAISGLVFLGFFVALAEAFLDPTFNKAVRETVPDEDVENAVAFQTSTQSISNFGGAVLGAILIDYLGVAKIFFLSSLSYLIAGIFNYLIKFRTIHAEREEITEISGFRILEGLPVIKKVLFGFGLVNFFVTPTLVIIPLYTSKTLSATASVMGQLEASLWIGLIAGTFFSKHFQFTPTPNPWFKSIKLILVKFGVHKHYNSYQSENLVWGRSKNAIKIGAVCIFTTAVSLIIPGIFIHKFVYMAGLFITGFSIGVNNVKFITLFQETIDSSIKGRFFALMQAMIGFTFPVAYFIFGFMADYFKPQHMCLLQGLGLLPLSVFFMNLAKSDSKNVGV